MRTRTPLLLAAASFTAVGALASVASAQTSTNCALPSGQTRLAHNGTTVCAPHGSTLPVSSDCCDWNTGICYPPSAQDTACGSSTGTTSSASTTTSAPATSTTTTSSTSSSTTSCAVPSGETRLANNGSTVCAPHPASPNHVGSDCCDWWIGVCYAPSATDTRCGSSTASGTTSTTTTSGSGTSTTSSGSTSSGSTSTTSSGTTTTSSSGGTTSTSSTSCAVPSGQTRLATDGTTVCAPHPASPNHVGSDCCDWWIGVCYAPSATDTRCGSSTAGGTTSTSSGSTTTSSSGSTGTSSGTTSTSSSGSTTTSSTSSSTSGPPRIAGCQIFPADNAWNQDISNAPVDPNSAMYINAMGASTGLHMDFGTNPAYGIPFQVVNNSTPTTTVPFLYSDESDHVGYPIPANPLIEGGNDHHILMLNSDTCVLYELFHAAHGTSGWTADSGAEWLLNQDWTRPAGWTSADEAGLAILPGLIRYDEVASGQITHALRFTVSQSQAAYVAPASHLGSNSDTTLPPMGLRVRLKASFNIAGYPAQEQVILRALQRYGMIVADDGGPWYVSGVSDSRWSDDALHTMDNVLGSNFEVVQMGPIHR